MKLDYHNIKDEGRFTVTSFQCGPSLQLLKKKGLYKIVWCTEGEERLIVDGYEVVLKKNQVLFCTPVNIVEIPKDNYGLIAFVFNREFYCIQHNDSEVSCMGMLFFGSSTAPIIDLTVKEQASFNAMLVLFQEEFDTKDHIQGEMLRTLLKRMLITSTRLIKQESYQPDLTVKQVDLVRRFNILVEQHFKEKHQVADYADLLFKSPKTLSNFFKKHDVKSPLKIINERITAEAKRLLLYSDKSAEEIAYELGYNEPSHFSKFFKKQVGTSPLSFRKQ
ncbi:AraC family transcriptional regulator [Nonlabens xylanidelens]|uniref:AraC family transcriptional regulator n=1 Tax=Nonlabens xylanidelens TaxID=191564 RepID=A0A2S6IJJ7_9FLAO|nr:AraC family transcriptional regulator [Nonlabens xylanidelens]PPK94404.1 AraC family transcriptional regulator [Nonlabens xylanidelens]PQJ21436.1 AraC family transcriptional regulator [Nonlabens xylanidelens]